MVVGLPLVAISGFAPNASAEGDNALLELAKGEAVSELKEACDAKAAGACEALEEAYDAAKAESEGTAEAEGEAKAEAEAESK